jgi:hypothetical protein
MSGAVAHVDFLSFPICLATAGHALCRRLDEVGQGVDGERLDGEWRHGWGGS